MTITPNETIRADAKLSYQELDAKYTKDQIKAKLRLIGVTQVLSRGSSYYSPVILRPLDSARTKADLLQPYIEAIKDFADPDTVRPTKNLRVRRTLELEGKGCSGQTMMVEIKIDKNEISFENDDEGYTFTTTVEDLNALLTIAKEESNV